MAACCLVELVLLAAYLEVPVEGPYKPEQYRY